MKKHRYKNEACFIRLSAFHRKRWVRGLMGVLFSLLAAQTQMFSSMLWQFSYSLANTFTYLPFDHFLYCNMAFLAAASVLLIALAALNLRVRKPRAPKGKRA